MAIFHSYVSLPEGISVTKIHTFPNILLYQSPIDFAPKIFSRPLPHQVQRAKIVAGKPIKNLPSLDGEFMLNYVKSPCSITSLYKKHHCTNHHCRLYMCVYIYAMKYPEKYPHSWWNHHESIHVFSLPERAFHGHVRHLWDGILQLQARICHVDLTQKKHGTKVSPMGTMFKCCLNSVSWCLNGV